MNGESGPGYQTGNAGELTDEPGAVENRLSLNPNDDTFPKEIGDWRDGEEYFLKVRVRQISPGEFEVLAAQPTDSEPEVAEPEMEEALPPRSPSGYSNPAIENL